MAPWGDGLRVNVLRQETADGDSIGIQIAPAVKTIMRNWGALNDVDRAAFKVYLMDTLRGGADHVFLLDTLDIDGGGTERKTRILNNPFEGAMARQNASALRIEMLEV